MKSREEVAALVALAVLALAGCLACFATADLMADLIPTANPGNPGEMGASHVDLVHFLTNESRYDKHQRPLDGVAPLNVSVRVFLLLVQSEEGRLRMHVRLNLLLQQRFMDPRLRYADLSPETRQVAGGPALMGRLWTPHVFMANERHSVLLSSGPTSDVLVRLLPDGHVVFSTRLAVTVRCFMKQGRFPFDEQECPLVFESWKDGIDDLELHWARPVKYHRDLNLASFTLEDLQVSKTVNKRMRVSDSDSDSDEKSSSSLYSALTMKMSFARMHGYYIMNFYMPSILLVVISWVSFWLEPDMIPARVLLGSSTMLTFITLSVETDRMLPVSYIKASEVWFVGCCTFIFGSLVEFAFVNTIWRKGQSVELRKVNTRHILRSTLSKNAPRPNRGRLLPQERYARRRTSSLPDIFKSNEARETRETRETREAAYYNTIHEDTWQRPSSLAVVSESTEALDLGGLRKKPSATVTFDCADEDEEKPRLPPQVAGTRRQSLSASLIARLSAYRPASFSPVRSWTRMSAQEVSAWIDTRSRVVFPLAFLVFNCVYWTTTMWF